MIINKDMVINEKANEIYKFFILEVTFFSIKFGGTVFVGTLYFRIVFVTFIILSQLITESPVILITQ